MLFFLVRYFCIDWHLQIKFFFDRLENVCNFKVLLSPAVFPPFNFFFFFKASSLLCVEKGNKWWQYALQH